MKHLYTAALALASVLGCAAQQTNLVVSTNDGARVAFPTDNVASVKFAEAPEYIAVDYLVGAQYSTYRGNGQYTVDVCTNPDEYGDPSTENDLRLTVVFTAPVSDDAYNAALPEGYYNIGNGSATGTWNVTKTMLTTRDGDDYNSIYLTGGMVDVRKDGEAYDIRFEMVTPDGFAVNLRYHDPITFTPATSEYEGFDDDINVAFDDGQARYYGNWAYPFADDVTMEFFTGEFDENGKQLEGYYMRLMGYTMKSADLTNPVIADGTYTIEQREEVLYFTNMPNTIDKGYLTDFFGQIYPAGSYVSLVERNGRNRIAFITGGTMTVSGGGKHFTFNFTTEDGLNITGSCDEFYVYNFVDNEDEPPLVSNLTADHSLNFASNAEAVYYNLGDYLIPGLNTIRLDVADPEYESGDMITLEVLCNGNAPVSGTYYINETFAPMTAPCGHYDRVGNLTYAWYGDLGSMTGDMHSMLAPVHGGSFTLNDNGNGTCTIDFNLVDIAGHNITGTWTGAFGNGATVYAPRHRSEQAAPEARKPVIEAVRLNK